MLHKRFPYGSPPLTTGDHGHMHMELELNDCQSWSIGKIPAWGQVIS